MTTVSSAAEPAPAPHPMSPAVATAARTVPGPGEAARLARDHDLVPLCREFLADSVTPVTVFEQFREPGEPGFLLENRPAGGAGGHSYVGFRPGVVPLPEGSPLDALKAAVAGSRAPLPGLPPFHGGIAGYLGYEAARHFERLPRAHGLAPGVEESAFLTVDSLAVFEHATGRLLLLTVHRPARESYRRAVRRLDAMEARLHSCPPVPRSGPAAAGPAGTTPEAEGWRSNVGRAEFERRVRRAREYVAAGEVSQVVISHRFSKPLLADPHDVYRELRAASSAPYLYHLSFGGGRHVIGASPASLVRAEGGRAWTRPLAGTRRRGAQGAADRALEEELRGDAKESGEHVMLVDLGRGDLSRVCRPGTVRVDRLLDVVRFSHVMHLSSTVSGRLAPGATGLDALRAAFPSGTLSGVPRIRAMEIIAELETDRRGVYGGAVGVAGFGGSAELAIGLRTLVVSDGMVHVQAGAGVVAGSDPALEYQETLLKAGGMFAAVRRAEAAVRRAEAAR